MSGPSHYLVGAYTPPQGTAAGIHRIVVDDGELRGGEPVAALASPSFVALHPTLPVAYAVAEHAAELVVLERDGTGLRVVQAGIPAGRAACHVRVDPRGDAVIVACWGDGQVLRYRLDGRGRVLDRAAAPAAADPHGPAGERASRAHASLDLGPDGGFVTTDLGFDLLRRWRVDDDGSLREAERLVLPEGSGPRHLVRAGDAIHVVTEYSNEVLTVRIEPAGLVLAGRTPLRVGGRREGDTAAEIALSPDGGWLTAGVRGSDVIASLRLGPDGLPAAVAEAPAGGAKPRHHVHTEDGLLVALQDSSRVVRLGFDAATGAIGPVLASLPVPSPTQLLRLP